MAEIRVYMVEWPQHGTVHYVLGGKCTESRICVRCDPQISREYFGMTEDRQKAMDDMLNTMDRLGMRTPGASRGDTRSLHGSGTAVDVNSSG